MAILVISCGGTTQEGDADAMGDPGEPCYPNDTCNSGLTCQGNTCVGGTGGTSGVTHDASTAGGGNGSSSQNPQGSERGACYPNGTCNDGLTCLSNFCVRLNDGGNASGGTGMVGSGGTSGEVSFDASPESGPGDGLDAGSDGRESGNTESLALVAATQQGAVGPDTALLSITGDLTLEAWIRPASFPVDGTDYPIVGKYARIDGLRCYIMTYVKPPGGPLSIGFAASADGINFPYLQIPYALTIGIWQHVAVTYRPSTGIAQFFVDGQSIGTVGGGSSTIKVANIGVTVGRFGDAGNAGAFWDGLVDEVRIWNTVRTQSEIDALRTVEVQGNETGLVAAWHFDGSYDDATPNGATLSPTNSPYFTTTVPF